MPTVADAARVLGQIAPLSLAEDWDNVGLLVGDPAASLAKLMTCLTLTPDVAQEAIDTGVGLVVSHHPLPFRPVTTLTTGDTTGETLWRLAGAGVAVYSAHTAYDSCVGGVNEQLAETFGLAGAEAMTPSADGAPGGVGRIGAAKPTASLADLVHIAREKLSARAVRLVGEPSRKAGRVAVACGSGGSLLDLALEAGCETFVTGEASFHDCLKARSAGFGMVLLGHFASEHFAMQRLAERLAAKLPGVACATSVVETDPIRTA